MILAGQVAAQTFTTLYNFTATSGSLFTNSDGAHPVAGLILSGDTLYGTAFQGGSSSAGTVFAINADGTGFTTLYNFTAPSYPSYPSANTDGAYPFGALILSSNTLYGTANGGGRWGQGTVFAINTDGTGFRNLHSLNPGNALNTNSEGRSIAALVLSSNTLYGTAESGGNGDNGTVFAVNTNGTGFTNLYIFSMSGLVGRTPMELIHGPV